jgi:hypothetical protein
MNYKRTLLALAIIALLLNPVQAVSGEADSHTIEGTWEVTVNLNNPNLPPSFEALETYSRSSGVITSNNMPFLTRIGQGAWQKVGNQFFVKIKFFKFDANGLPSGTITVTHTIRLNSKNEYTGTGTAVLCEADGTTCLSVAFDTEGRRLTAEP